MRGKSTKVTTLVGSGAELNGDFSAKESARIDGRINGNVVVEGTLILGSGSYVGGSITAEVASIGGEVYGDINAPAKVELTETAKVIGDISTAVIVIDEKAVFQGKIDMNQDVPARGKPKKVKAKPAVKKSAKAALAEALKEVAAEEEKEFSEEATNEVN